jgi:small ligand-binding sensory domain FIST
MGLDQESGVMVVGDYINEGETVQFHLRDASTAEEDLEMMLTPQQLFDAPCGGFLFSCNGRGTRLYNHPNGDISIIQKVMGGIDLAGFFCAGEIGPIGGKNFLHGHTASLALFRPQGEGN